VVRPNVSGPQYSGEIEPAGITGQVLKSPNEYSHAIVEWNPASDPSLTIRGTVTGNTPDGKLIIRTENGAEVKRSPDSVRNVPAGNSGKLSPDDLLAAVNRLEPTRGVPVSTLRLRAEFPDVSKEDFDKAALELRKQQRAFLGFHADPHNLTPEDRALLIHDPEESPDQFSASGVHKGGTYYVGVAAREPGLSSRAGQFPALNDMLAKAATMFSRDPVLSFRQISATNTTRPAHHFRPKENGT
jgi:hypothetical protein